MGPELTVSWRYFSLEQVNSQQGPEWKLWEQPEDYPSRGRRAFLAAEAARHQGEDAFDRFHFALLTARHEQRRDIADVNTLVEVAASVDLEITGFRQHLDDRQQLARLAEDHTFAVDTMGIFGTPTLVFPERQAIFLRIAPPPSPADCLSVFTEVRLLAEGRRYIREIKRPQLPSK